MKIKKIEMELSDKNIREKEFHNKLQSSSKGRFENVFYKAISNAWNDFFYHLNQNVKGSGGYIGEDGVPRLNVLDLHKKIREIPKPVIAMVNGYAIGGGHVLHVVCDLTIASENAIFGQTGPKVGSFDGGFGSSYLARHVGQKKAREIWFLCRQYNAQQALDMGLVNSVVPLENLEEETLQWSREMLNNSPMALRCLKSAMNADCDGQAGIQELAGNTTMLFYMSEEGQEGRNAYLEKRKPDFSKFTREP